MSFYQELSRWPLDALEARIVAASADDVRRALEAARPGPADLMAMLSPAAAPFLEQMARKAHDLTLRHFGRTIQLFTPLYLANHCTNQCRYCGFNARNKIVRNQLSPEQIEAEGKAIAATGLRQLLLLTGDAPTISTVAYIADAARRLRRYFPSIGIEVYAMQTEEYAEVVNAGVESLTMFQETYNEELYAYLHPAGPKRDFRFRLDAPERGCLGGMRSVGLGALLGLDQWRRDAFLTVMHGEWLQKHYPATDVSFSVPRMRPHTGAFQPTSTVSDRELVQIMAAYRIYMPMAGITVSSREGELFRDNLVPLGVTRMSAGVSTAVGGHASEGNGGDEASPNQFEISDDRSVDEMVGAISERGYQPVFKDWEPPLDNVYACGRPQAMA